jgi:antagonist of KipI
VTATSAELLIVKPGLMTTVQDLGRWGLQARGVSVAGPMDPPSHRVANALAGNPPDAATLEVTLIGPDVQFMDDRVAAVAGAEFELWLDGRPVSAEGSFAAAAGSRLRFGRRVRGSRAYLAVAGGIAVSPELGSRATHIVSRMGGLEGRALVSGDRLPLGSGLARSAGATSRSPIVLPDGHARVRVLQGPQDARFEAGALEAVQAAPYRIGNESDRMAFRLHGPALKWKRSEEIISDATPLGVLQVPASGQPMLLMADRQTTGGYPTIATVITADIGLAGQLAPGDTIQFEICSRREAMAALIAQERALMAIEGRVGA